MLTAQAPNPRNPLPSGAPSAANSRVQAPSPAEKVTHRFVCQAAQRFTGRDLNTERATAEATRPL
ncbi:glutaminase [Anopheles sinensis]|uniref:Glutaminase n=1 Tax=Anopheles sinensis TaxID=74873 RepID=A0A084VYC0_ANOSI|nr:glutaminase [Anopheles sinensis]